MQKLKFYKKSLAVLGLTAFLLTGCEKSYYIAADATEENVIDSNNTDSKSVEPQVLDVDGEDFKLVVKYSLKKNEDFKWRITEPKTLFADINTQDLSDDCRVWVNSVHTETFLVSTDQDFNGLLQESSDHYGIFFYPMQISNKIGYISTLTIGGVSQNDDFLKNMVAGEDNISDDLIEQKMYTDEYYLENGVCANEINLLYELLVQGPNDDEPHTVYVKSKVYVLVYNRVEKSDKDNNIIYVYEFDMNGNSRLVDSYKVDNAKTRQISY